jgi:hypothetical protein
MVTAGCIHNQPRARDALLCDEHRRAASPTRAIATDFPQVAFLAIRSEELRDSIDKTLSTWRLCWSLMPRSLSFPGCA